MIKLMSMAAGAGLVLALAGTPAAEAAPRNAPGIASDNVSMEFSGQRRAHRRGYRHVRRGFSPAPRYYYAAPRYRYAAPYYYAPPRYYAAPRYYYPSRYYGGPYYRSYGPSISIGGPGFHFGFGGW